MSGKEDEEKAAVEPEEAARQEESTPSEEAAQPGEAEPGAAAETGAAEEAGAGEAGAPAEGKAKRRKSRLWTPGGDVDVGGEEPAGGGAPGAEEGLSEEEMRQRIEEALEKITVADVLIDMMITLSSLAYQKMGIPKNVNEKYRDLEQARLAIDCLEAMLSSLGDRIGEDQVRPLASTLDNLKLNFAKES